MDIDKKALTDLLVDLGVDTARDWDVQTLESKINENGIAHYIPSPMPSMSDDSKSLLGGIMEAQSHSQQIVVIADPFARAFGDLPKPELKKEEPEPEQVVEVAPVAKVEADNAEVEQSYRSKDAENESSDLPSEPRKRSYHRRQKPVKAATRKPKIASRKQSPARAVAVRKKRQRKEPVKRVVKENEHEPMSRGRGVARTVVAALTAAGEREKPITKRKIMEILAKKFPEHSEHKMRTTVDNLLGSRLCQLYGIDVQKTKNLSKVKNKCPNCGCSVSFKRGERGYWLDNSTVRKKSAG